MRRRQLSRGLAGATGLILAVALGGCSNLLQAVGEQGGSDIEASPVIPNRQLSDEVDLVLAQIWDGNWDPPPGGNLRRACELEQGGDAYYFYGSWFTPLAATTPVDQPAAESAAAELRTWLDSRGWNKLDDYQFTSADDEVEAVVLSGTTGTEDAIELQVAYYFAGRTPQVVVDVDSGCLAADR